MDEIKRMLKIDLQHFAEQGEGADEGDVDNVDDPQDPTGDEPENKNGKGGQEGDNNDKDGSTLTMTQDELNRIISDRLARERKKQEEKEQQLREEAEKERLKENQDYKDLAEKLEQQLKAQQAEVLNTKKNSLLIEAGYTAEQATTFSKLLEGETDEELQDSLKTIKTLIPSKPYADPSPGNGRRQEPAKKDGKDVGANAWDRIKGKIRK